MTRPPVFPDPALVAEALERAASVDIQAIFDIGPLESAASAWLHNRAVDGIWVVWHTDWHAFVDGIFGSEIEARRFADDGHYKHMGCNVDFFPFGEWEPFGSDEEDSK